LPLASRGPTSPASHAYGHEHLVVRRPFHSRQVLTLMKTILAETSNIGRPQPFTDSESAFRLGRCLIMTNDFLVTPQNISAISPSRPPSERKMALQLQVGSGLEINNPPPIHTSIVRSDMIFGNIASTSKGSLDLRNAFRRERGMAIEEYLDHLLAVLTYCITLDFRKLIDDPPGLRRHEHLFLARTARSQRRILANRANDG